MMDLEFTTLWTYRHIDVITVILVCIIVYINLPDLLVKLYGTPYGLAMLVSLAVMIIPMLIVWLLFIIYTVKSEISGDFKKIIEAIEKGIKAEEFKILDSFYVKAHIIPQVLVQLLLITLLLLSSNSGWLVKIIVAILGTITLPLFTPLFSRSLSGTEVNNSLKDRVRDILNIKVNFIGVVKSSIINAYVVSSPLYKVIYFTTEALKLNQEELNCLLAHESYHLRYNNTYLSSVILLSVVSLIYIIVSRALEIRVLNFREAFSLITLILYLSTRLLSKLIMRRLEIKADIFAARAVGHDNYLKFLAKLRMTSIMLSFFNNNHPDIKKRIDIIKNYFKDECMTSTQSF